MVNTDLKDASLDYDIVKMEAIDATPGLGKKEDNIRKLTNLKLKKNDLQSDRIKINANKDATKRQMQELNETIKAQEDKVKNFTMETAKPAEKAAPSPEKDKAPEPPAAPKAPAAPEEKTK
jgi:hypothetical protein